MDPFQIALVSLGAVAIWTGYNEYQYMHAGDTVKSLGPAPPETTKPKDPQTRRLWISDGSTTVTGLNPHNDKPARDRQTTKMGGNIRHNTGKLPRGRLWKDPGADLFGYGQPGYYVFDPRFDMGKGTMLSDSETPSLERLAAHNPHYVDPSDTPGLLHPQPLAGLLNARQYGQQANNVSLSMLYAPKNNHWHNRDTTTTLTDWSAGQSDEVTSHNYWRGFPNATNTADGSTLTFPRGKPHRQEQRLSPFFQHGQISKKIRVGMVR